MKTFQQFMTEVYDPEIQGRSQIKQTGADGRRGNFSVEGVLKQMNTSMPIQFSGPALW